MGTPMALLNKLGQVLTTEITADFIFNRKNQAELSESAHIQQIKQRKSVQKLGKKLPHEPAYLIELIQSAVKSSPSVINSQTTRIVILLEKAHADFWNLVKEIQRTQVPEQFFSAIEHKIDQSLAAYGTVLFFEDQSILQNLQKNLAINAEQLPSWSAHSAGMAQYAVWTALADEGIGAHFNYYNPAIDYRVSQHLQINPHWKLQTQMVFGSIEQVIENTTMLPNEAEFMVLS